MDGFLDRAVLKTALFSRPQACEKVKEKVLQEATEELRGAYRYCWGLPTTRAVLCKASHLMIWSDNDVANDFTELEHSDGCQLYSPELILAGMNVYTEYQRQLWSPECEGEIKHSHQPESKETEESMMEEWHFHVYGKIGVFLADMRGNRISTKGEKRSGNICSDEQKEALLTAFDTAGLMCMIVASEIPFVSDASANVQTLARKFKFLEGHWAHEQKFCTWLYELCFDWKAARKGREVILIGGDIHCGLVHELKDSVTDQVIRSITTSPITNHVCPYYFPLEGTFNDRFSYTAKHFPDQRNFAVLDVSFTSDDHCCVDVHIELVPTRQATSEDVFTQ